MKGDTRLNWVFLVIFILASVFNIAFGLIMKMPVWFILIFEGSVAVGSGFGLLFARWLFGAK